MKKILARLLAMMLVIMTMLTLSSAALAVEKDGPGLGESISFNVKTSASGTHKVKATFDKGKLFLSNRVLCCNEECRGSYEAIVYFKNSAGNWQWESQKTCYNTKSVELKLQRNSCEYKIVFRAKTASVMWNSYVNNGIITPCAKCKTAFAKCNNYLLWRTSNPDINLTKVSNITSIK